MQLKTKIIYFFIMLLFSSCVMKKVTYKEKQSQIDFINLYFLNKGNNINLLNKTFPKWNIIAFNDKHLNDYEILSYEYMTNDLNRGLEYLHDSTLNLINIITEQDIKHFRNQNNRYKFIINSKVKTYDNINSLKKDYKNMRINQFFIISSPLFTLDNTHCFMYVYHKWKESNIEEISSRLEVFELKNNKWVFLTFFTVPLNESLP